MVDVVWTLAATIEFKQAFARFEDSRDGGGLHFADEVESKTGHLAPFPQIGPVYDAPFRRLLVFAHDYAIYYTVEARGVIIHALLDCRQNPESIRRRLRNA